MKNTKQEKGITLIALVITIIVMLILVTVSITMAVKGGLFNYAKDAATQTNTKMEEENKLATGIINVEGKGEMDINAIVESYKTDTSAKLIHFTIDGIECTAEEGMTWEDWYNSEYSDNIDGWDKDSMEIYEEKDPEAEVPNSATNYGDYYLFIDGCGISIDQDLYDAIDTEIIDGASYSRR